MPGPTLSYGTLEQIILGYKIKEPIFQLLAVKSITIGNEERIRLLISDGKHKYSYFMLGPQLKQLYDEGQLTDYTVVCINNYISTMVNSGHRAIIILDLTVLISNIDQVIGKPKDYKKINSLML